MLGIELACAVIVALYLALRLRAAEDRTAVVARLAVLAVASFLAEDSVIHAYGFYHYASGWDLFVDQVPLLIALIWPVVIDSAFRLGERLAPRPTLVPALTFVVVLADASLIEPVSVHAGLWSWTEAGIFDVPLVGILGWAIFAASAVALGQWRSGAMLLAALPTHAALLAVWWALFRWLPRAIDPWAAVAAAWVLMGIAATLAGKRRVPAARVWMRAPGAAFFFVVLSTTAPRSAPLFAYSFAFAPAYLVLAARGRGVVELAGGR